MNFLFQTMAVLAMAPLVIFPPIVILALLTGAIRPARLWSHDANSAQVSPARVTQFLFGLGAAAVTPGPRISHTGVTRPDSWTRPSRRP